MQEVDLKPHEWRSDKAKQQEPILGPGAGPLLGELTIMALGFGLLIVVALAGIYLKDTVSVLLYGETRTAQTIEGVTKNGIHWRIN